MIRKFPAVLQSMHTNPEYKFEKKITFTNYLDFISNIIIIEVANTNFEKLF